MCFKGKNMKKTLTKITAVILTFIIVFSFAGCETKYEQQAEAEPYPLAETVFLEAGEAIPDESGFIVSGEKGSFVTDMSQIQSVPGFYDVTIAIGEEEYTTYLIINDTKAPEGETKELCVTPGTEVKPEDFFVSLTDATAVTAEFKNEIDTTALKRSDVEIILTDEAGNASEFKTSLVVSNLAPVTIEARKEALLVSDITNDETAVISGTFIPDKVGTFDIEVDLGGEKNIAVLSVVDTVAPTAQGGEFVWYLNDDMDPAVLVSEAFDITEITYTFKTAPDMTKEDAQSVTVVLTDEGGNTTEVTSTMTLIPDTEAPEIFGLTDHMYFYQGGPISYLSTVYAQDNCTKEEDIVIEVDKSKVDIYTLGEYEVKYTAKDKAGNTSEKTVVIELIKQSVTQEQLDAAVAQTLAEITTEDMSIGEKAFRVYTYIREKMVYSDASDKTDYIKEAHKGLTEFRGDCFTFYAATDALLRGIGADTIKVSRQKNATRPSAHYWVLCNLGTGWYHIDTCNVGPRNFEAFMRTDDEFTTRAATYWKFDASLYPASPTTPYVKDFE